jgi:PleD family two-component response regulator/HPt (histidine-containing phosphotransfer) domain-containing protein
MQQTIRSVLVLDDDRFFRLRVERLLAPRGYKVLQAHDGKQADQLLARVRPALLIVAYRLPDIDGMTWVEQIRAKGYNMPIVFISGSFCNSINFDRLRNNLKVSLVLQKPIVPDLFLQQIEDVLPLGDVPPEETFQNSEAREREEKSPTLKKEYELLIERYPDLKESIDDAIEAISAQAKGKSEKELLEQLRQVGRKLQVESALHAAKQDYAKQLPNEWRRLSAAVGSFQSEPDNVAFREEAIGISHQLHGTSGSLGFSQVSEAAARVEHFLKTIDVTEYTESEVIWSEVFRALSDGESAVRTEPGLESASEAVKSTGKTSKLLALTIDDQLLDQLEFIEGRLSIEVIRVDSTQSALSRARTEAFDGVVIDLNLDAAKDYLQLCRDLRSTAGNEQVPFAFVEDEEGAMSPGALKYAGASAVLPDKQTNEEFLEQMELLLTISREKKPRVLAVDDDEVLSSFIASVLAGEGMIVHTLKDPIRIIEKLEVVRPDVLILDVLMPGLSGYDVCRLLRGTEQWSQLPILFLTSKNTPEGKAAAFHAGADDFLSKPVLTEELTARVMTQIERVRVARLRAESDELTGCKQRLFFLRELKEILESNPEQVGCLYFAKIDQFEELIASQGIYAHEGVLAAVGQLVRCRFKPEVRRCRWSDDTFAFYFIAETPGASSSILSALTDEIETMSFKGNGGEFKVVCRLSFAGFPTEAENVAELVELASRRIGSILEENAGAIVSS